MDVAAPGQESSTQSGSSQSSLSPNFQHSRRQSLDETHSGQDVAAFSHMSSKASTLGPTPTRLFKHRSRRLSPRQHIFSSRTSTLSSDRPDRTKAASRRLSPWKRLNKSKYAPVMVLKNTSSVARDHLSSERTFLAYMRTSLGLCLMGVALVQLFALAESMDLSTSPHLASGTRKLQRIARPLGAVTVAFSLILLLQGTWRYFKIQFSLFDNMFPIARISTAFQTFVFTSITIAIFASMLAGN